MKAFMVVLTVLAAILALAGQPIIFETSDWGIAYLNAHPHLIKPVPLLIGVGFSFLFALAVMGSKNIAKPAQSQGVINPFWGWFGGSVLANIIVNLLLE